MKLLSASRQEMLYGSMVHSLVVFPTWIFFCAGLKQELGLGEKVIADCGYRGDANVCTPDDWKDEANKKAMGQL